MMTPSRSHGDGRRDLRRLGRFITRARGLMNARLFIYATRDEICLYRAKSLMAIYATFECASNATKYRIARGREMRSGREMLISLHADMPSYGLMRDDATQA